MESSYTRLSIGLVGSAGGPGFFLWHHTILGCPALRELLSSPTNRTLRRAGTADARAISGLPNPVRLCRRHRTHPFAKGAKGWGTRRSARYSESYFSARTKP